RKLLRVLFEHRPEEVAQAKLRQEFGVERVSRHAGFVYELMIPSQVACAPVEGERQARVRWCTRRKCRETSYGGCVAAGHYADSTEQAVALCRFVDNFKECTDASKQAGRRFQRLRPAAAVEPAPVDGLDRLQEQIVVRHHPTARIRGLV